MRFSIPGLIGDERDRYLRNSLQLAHAAHACAKWLSENAEIRAVASPILQNLFCIENADGLSATVVSGSATFTSSGLGFAPANGYGMSTLFDDSAQIDTLIKKFDSIWREDSADDVKEHVLRQLERIYTDKAPELIYYLILYNIFNKTLGDLREDHIIKQRTGIKDTLVWKKLYRFQRDGVLGAIDKIDGSAREYVQRRRG